MSWSQQLFGLASEDLPLTDLTVAAWQQEQLDAAGGPNADVALGSDVVASAEVIRELKTASVADGRSVRATVAAGSVHEEFGLNTLGSVEESDGTLAYNVSAGVQMADAEPFVFDRLLDVVAESPQPGRMNRPIIAFGGERFIWSINHWYDLLVINLLAVQTRCGRIRANDISQRAIIHPQAVVENSIIDDDAIVGPFAVVQNSHIHAGAMVDGQANVRGSIIGEDSVLQSQCLVHGSVVGPETVVSFQTAVRGSLLFGQSTISAPVVARSVVGPDTFLARDVAISASTLTDAPVRVSVGSRTVCTGARLVGCAVGRATRIGNGISIPAGRTVPAGLRIAARPMPRFDKDLPTPTSLLVDGARIRTLPTLNGPSALKGTQQ